MTKAEIDGLLAANADEKYREFNAKIVNTKLHMVGVRTPFVKELAKKIAADPQDFFDTYDPENYEQILLYALAFSFSKKLNIREKFARFDYILPKFDNWAHVDVTVGAFKDLRKHREEFLNKYGYLVSAPEFERRFMAVFLMDYCLAPEYLDTVFDLYEKMQCDMYYVNMGIAWGLSVALVKFYEPTFGFLKRGTLDEFIVRKTVQKARESYRITAEQKEELREWLKSRQ